jgi:hypothetical protein
MQLNGLFLHTYMDMKKSIFYVVTGLLVLLGSCDNKPKIHDEVVIPPPINGSVWIVNEGNFQSGNSTLSVLNFTNGQLYQDVFENNNGRKLGDVFQSVNIFHGRAYLVVNNSKKIEVVDPSTYKAIGVINGFTSPRYILPVNEGKAYVSEYYADAISIVDLNNNTISGSIAIKGWMDEMVMVNDKVYVTNAKKEYVYIIDALSDKLEDSIKVVYAPVSIQVDAQNKIWVLSNGKTDQTVRPALQRINPATKEVERNMSLFFSEADVSRLRTNAAKDKVYWLSRHVYTHDIKDSVVLSTPFIRSVFSNYYGLGVDPRTNELYISDAKDFVQRSNISRYNSSGIAVGDFTAGLITGDFFFYYP